MRRMRGAGCMRSVYGDGLPFLRKELIEILPSLLIVTVIAPQLLVRYSGVWPTIASNRFCLLVNRHAFELTIICAPTARKNAGVSDSLLP